MAFRKERFWTHTDTERAEVLQLVDICRPKSECHFSVTSSRCFMPSLGVRSAFDLAFDVIALAEESEPVVEHLLVLIREIRPIGTAFFRFQRGLSESAGCILAGEDFKTIVSAEEFV